MTNQAKLEQQRLDDLIAQVTGQGVTQGTHTAIELRALLGILIKNGAISPSEWSRSLIDTYQSVADQIVQEQVRGILNMPKREN